MITGMCGNVAGYHDGVVMLDVNSVLYEILTADIDKEQFTELYGVNGRALVLTHHYLQIMQSAAWPMLVGFLDGRDREFFFQLLEVKGIGPKTAVKAMSKPVAEIARLIDEGNKDLLRKLPGISLQRAQDIISKLQGKMGSYYVSTKTVASVMDTAERALTNKVNKVAIEGLIGLGYEKGVAFLLVKEARERNSCLTSVQSILDEVFKPSKDC
jgi:Holliday junction DNA helicase RuvA